MNFGNLVGQTLDEKYRIEKELGQGGMGAVYLATHIGTERPVAVKVIVPQFMERAEFVERFRREARAAGRLRHPNVVDITDFGFDDTPQGRVAYLVMEYLDGCTLGEILEEEKRLPLGWTLDILEQVSSAVGEAHRQGIIHRDLKPDNIWLEPNQRGGYTVKVLDFGIAKLETPGDENPEIEENASAEFSLPNKQIAANPTVFGQHSNTTFAEQKNLTAAGDAENIAENKKTQMISNEASTLIHGGGDVISENKTAILSEADGEADSVDDAVRTKLMSVPGESGKSAERNLNTDRSGLDGQETKELTRVGAVLGTPLYMSPEQCRGEHLMPQSDIYSLGVIAYQMLGGKTPFEGSFTSVMDAHQGSEPPVLEAKKVPRGVKKVIMSALSKNPSERPPTAEAFASKLRAQSEGIGTLLRKSLAIYGQHLPTFLGLTILFYIPFTLATILKIAVNFLYVGEMIDNRVHGIINALLMLAVTFTGIFCGYLIFGTITWIVTQILAMPLRPVSLRPAFAATRKKWKSLVGTGLMTTVLTFIGYALCFLPGIVLSVIWALVAPLVMMENLRGRAALKRSKMLVMRSLRTTIAAVFIMFFVPFLVASIVSFFAATTVNAYLPKKEKPAEVSQTAEGSATSVNTAAPVQSNDANSENNIVISINGTEMNVRNKKSDNDDRTGRIREVLREALVNIFMLPFQIGLASLSSIIIALLYLKTRQAGGESMQDLLKQLEETDRPNSRWQERVQRRLLQSGRITGRSKTQ